MYLAVVAALFLIMASCQNQESVKREAEVFEIDFESIDDFADESKQIVIGKMSFSKDRLIRNKSKSGTNSVLVNSKNQYGVTFRDSNVAVNTRYIASVWRTKGSRKNKGILTISCETNKGNSKFQGSFIPVDQNAGWELLRLDFMMPKYTKGIVKIHCWNDSEENVNFDDFRVEKYIDFKYERNEELPSIDIELGKEENYQISKMRFEASKQYVILKKYKKWVAASVLTDSVANKSKLRLKGDWTDHLIGEKWSFRVKSDDAENKLASYSLISPDRRDYLNEWLFHKWMKDEGVLTSQYDFVNLRLNGDTMGLYVKEEHFSQQMLRNNNRTEGVILKFDECAIWSRNWNRIKNKNEWGFVPAEAASPILAFNNSEIKNNEALVSQVEKAQKLLWQFQFLKGGYDKIFDFDKMAKFYAITEIAKAAHGFIFHNLRFYYNPDTELIEPVAYDSYSNNGEQSHSFPVNLYGLHKTTVHGYDDAMGDYMMKYLLNNADFRNKYIHYLKEFSNPDYINDLMSKHGGELEKYEQILRMEFPWYAFNDQFLKGNAKQVRVGVASLEKTNDNNYYMYEEEISNCDTIPMKHLGLIGYYEQEEQVIKVYNFYCNQLIIKKIVFGNDTLILNKSIEGYNGYVNLEPSSIKFDKQPDKLIYEDENGNEFKGKVYNYFAQ